jgi:hypothetical protein
LTGDVAEPSDIERDLQTLSVELRRLEAEYNMYFAGRLPRPPVVTRSRVDALFRKWDRAHIDSLSLRFRFATMQSRFAVFSELWDRGMRAREEGRAGPFSQARARRESGAAPQSDRVVHVAAFSGLQGEPDKLRDLYDSLMSARREAGEQVVDFDRFAGLVQQQIERLQHAGAAEVAFRVSMTGGKAKLTAKGVRAADAEPDG